jgi:hypothetical protein
MLKNKSGDTVGFGFYWNTREWNAQIVPKEGGVLEGVPETTFVRLPLLAVLALAPLMGAVYAFFLPFIGIAMVMMYLAGRLRAAFKRTPPAAEAVVGAPAAGAANAGTEKPAYKKAA